MAPQEAKVEVRAHISEAYSKHAHSLCFTLCLQQKAKPRGIHTPLNEMLIHYRVYPGIRLASSGGSTLEARGPGPSPLIFEPKPRPGVEAPRYFVSPKEACLEFEREPQLYLKLWIRHMQIHISSPGWKEDNAGKSPLRG